jgi:hypothetical protein
MNKNKNRILSDFNPTLWNQAEEEELRLQEKTNRWCSSKVKYLSKKLIELKKELGKNTKKEKEYYKLRDELIDLCQTGFFKLGLSTKDKNWVWDGLLCLSSLYDNLITRIVKGFVIKYDNQIDFDEAKSYAQQLFWRLITGDTPWAIEAFANQEKPSHETKAALSNIQMHKTKKEVQSNLNQFIEILKELNFHPEDLKLVKFLFKKDIKHFSEWINQPVLSFPDWVRAVINRQIKLRQDRLSLKLIKNQKQVNKYQRDIAKLQKIIKEESSLYALIKNNVLFFEKEYEKYKKSCYKEEKYENGRGIYFTTYINEYLALRLSDLYKRKELKIRPLVSLEKHKDWDSSKQNQSYSSINTKDYIKKIRAVLTPRENDVFSLMLNEFRGVDIAKRLSISKGRVSQLVTNIRRKAKEIDFPLI